jgi:formate/nitrite transporter FocA (FNT family)
MVDIGISDAGEHSPVLNERERQQAAERKPVGSLVIHEIVREEGNAELARPISGLLWSGLAAGLSIGFSFLMQANIKAALPEAPWSRLVAAFGYTLGFLIVVLGRQQLFTETTLTALVPTLTERSLNTLLATIRVWALVLISNMVGTWIFAAISAQQGVFSPETYAAMSSLAEQSMSHPFLHTTMTGISAGWLIGLMVWLLPGAGPARPLIIILLTYAIAACEFPHIVAGSVEAAFGVVAGKASVLDYTLRFFVPTLIGNSIGGTALAALLNHAPIAGELGKARTESAGEAEGV